MALIPLLLGLAVVAFLVYLIVTYIPMPEAFRAAIIAIAVVCLIIWLMQQLHVVGPVLRTP